MEEDISNRSTRTITGEMLVSKTSVIEGQLFDIKNTLGSLQSEIRAMSDKNTDKFERLRDKQMELDHRINSIENFSAQNRKFIYSVFAAFFIYFVKYLIEK